MGQAKTRIKSEQTTPPKAAQPTKARTRKKHEAGLDEALEETFPASDPVSVGHETGDEATGAREDRKTPPLDVGLIKELARDLKREQKRAKD